MNENKEQSEGGIASCQHHTMTSCPFTYGAAVSATYDLSPSCSRCPSAHSAPSCLPTQTHGKMSR
ncbi:rCG58447 [Rattus norvegicus]|uniref:RCG58447 n=1 Tax=Rattus norvegicus TaxID=10116 RepID=A6J3U1_RAT|nr:rCG58447 [Rattus norvegicus]